MREKAPKTEAWGLLGELSTRPVSPLFKDGDDQSLHDLIKKNDFKGVQKLINDTEERSGLDSPELIALLEDLNYEGKSAFYIAAEVNSTKIAFFLADKLPELNLMAKYTLNGDTAFHHAIRNNNFELIQLIFDVCEDKINVSNKVGETPYKLGMKSVQKRISDLFKISKFAPKAEKASNQGSVLTSRDQKPSRPTSKRVIISDNRVEKSSFLTASDADKYAA
jgi:hypothetical protein